VLSLGDVQFVTFNGSTDLLVSTPVFGTWMWIWKWPSTFVTQMDRMTVVSFNIQITKQKKRPSKSSPREKSKKKEPDTDSKTRHPRKKGKDFSYQNTYPTKPRKRNNIIMEHGKEKIARRRKQKSDENAKKKHLQFQFFSDLGYPLPVKRVRKPNQQRTERLESQNYSGMEVEQ